MRPKKQSVTERQHVRRPASLLTQCKALVRQNFALQKRRWKTNLAVVLTPVLFCALLHGLSVLIENELGSVNFRCGCKCTSCFDWVLVEDDGLMRYEYRFFEATPQKPCLRSSKCQSYDTTTCGVQYSKDKQAPFCAIEVPPIYPPFIKIPLSATGADSYVHTTPALYTGQNKEVSRKLMNHLIPENQTRAVHLLELFGSGIELDTTLDPMGFLSNSNNCPHNTNLFDQPTADDFTIQQTEEDFDAEQMKKLRQASDATPERGHGMLSRELLELVNNFTHTLSDLGVVMGTPSSSSKSLFLEPALLPPTTSEPLYIVLHNCSSLTDVQLEGLKRASCGTEMMIGRSLHCVTLEPTWRPTADDIDYELYCGWKNSPCVAQKQVNASVKGEQHMQEYISAVFDWKTTRNRHFLVEIRVNDTVTTTTKETPELQRYNEPLNLAANAFLRQQMNDSEYYVRLYGLKGMPKPETRLSIDFSALLGPVFFLWLFQMLLPVNVHNLMYEKQHHLRIMMKMQGLDDRVYYLVTYMWQYLIYCCFILVFIVSGSWLGLSVLTKNQISLQIVFYALWGHVMIAWGFWLSSAFRQHKSAVHTAIVWVIGSGLMGSFLLGPFIIRGPSWIAHAMQTAPSFGLYRGVWELAQYSFLASYNAGAGLTWHKLSDANNGMIRVLITFSVEWILFLLGAWYNDQVLDNGMGTRRHPLFFLGYTYDKKSKEKENVISFTDEKVEIPLESCSPKSEPAFDVALKFTHPPLRQRSVSNQKGSKGSTKSGSSKTAVSRTSAGTSRVVGGTPIDDGVTGTGSYWGSGGSMPSSPVTASPPKLLSNSSRGLAALLEVPVSPVNRHDIHEIARTRTIEAIGQRSAHAFCDDDAPDVAGERLRVEQIWDSNRLGREDLDGDGAIVLRNLRKVYPKRGQAYPKVAVKNLSLAISRQQCFGLLGPNGAGKTTTIRMMEGFLEPSSGSVVIAGYDTKQDMSTIYSFMGACPQHDLLWETLTAREHLLFYGRLKNLKGENLTNAVYASLKSVNLLNDAVGDKQVRTYSGGMKRRLSVAIALIGDPLVAYLDEPSTGLDPSSRRLLWDVIKKAKKKTAIVLTTHSMEEAEALCDRLGIFVNGQLQCIGNPKDLTSRYGSYLQFSITTAIGQDEITAASIYELCPTARPVYALGGTQKFELPTKDVQLQDVFAHMEQLKQQPHMNVLDWGVSNATLEEVFIKITNAAGVKMTAFA